MEPIRATMAVGREKPDWADTFNEEMADFWNGEAAWNVPMAEYTTFGVGGPAEAMVFPRGSNELALLLMGLRKINVPWVVIGRGSNLLVADQGIRGVVIVLDRRFGAIEEMQRRQERVFVRVEAGCALSRLVNWAADKGLSGLEFAAGIPGSVGGAIVMNAGAWQREMRDVLQRVAVLDGTGCSCVRHVEELRFTYRSWGEKRDKIALEGFFSLTQENPAAVRERGADFVRRRKERQPLAMPSAGSFFKNPLTGKTAGQLIDEAGLKGVCVGGAMISPVHANFIVNCGGATAADIVALMERVRHEVQSRTGVWLEPEVVMLGMGKGADGRQ